MPMAGESNSNAADFILKNQAKLAGFNFSTRLNVKPNKLPEENIAGDGSFKSAIPAVKTQRSKSNMSLSSHERSFKSSYSGSMLEPTPESSVWTRHSESSLYALPRLEAPRKKTTLQKLSLIPDGLQNVREIPIIQ